MQSILHDSLMFSFQKVVEESVLEIFNGNGMTEFKMKLRDGMNEICCTIQKRLMEFVD